MEQSCVALDAAHSSSRSTKGSFFRRFRLQWYAAWITVANLSIVNMDWEDFAECTDKDGVFRGFP